MREFFILGALVPLAAVAQLALLPAWLPVGLRPDLGLLMALAGMAFLRREVGLGFLFVLGVQADLLGSARFGLLTLGYLSAGAVLLSVEAELVRAGGYGAWLAAIGGTAVAHGTYVLLAPLCGVELGFWEALGGVGYLTLSAALFGGILAYGLGRLWGWTGLLSPEVCAVRAQGARRHGWKLAWQRRRR